MGGEDHAAGVAAPVLDIEGGVVLGQVRVAGVAEDRLDEIEIADEVAGGEEARFQAELGTVAWDFGPDRGAEHQRDPAIGLILLAGGEGEFEQLLRRLHRHAEQADEGFARHLALVASNGEPTLHNVKGPGGGAAVAAGVVQNAVLDAVGGDDLAGEGVAVGGEREFTGDAVTVKDDCATGEAERVGGADDVREVAVEELLDALVGGAAVVLQEPRLLIEVGEQTAGEGDEFLPVNAVSDRLSMRGEFEVDVPEQFVAGALNLVGGESVTESEGEMCVHGGVLDRGAGGARSERVASAEGESISRGRRCRFSERDPFVQSEGPVFDQAERISNLGDHQRKSLVRRSETPPVLTCGWHGGHHPTSQALPPSSRE